MNGMNYDSPMDKQFNSLLRKCNDVLREAVDHGSIIQLQAVLMDLFANYQFLLTAFRESSLKAEHFEKKCAELEKNMAMAS